jgi:hypothetical protein
MVGTLRFAHPTDYTQLAADLVNPPPAPPADRGGVESIHRGWASRIVCSAVARESGRFRVSETPAIGSKDRNATRTSSLTGADCSTLAKADDDQNNPAPRNIRSIMASSSEARRIHDENFEPPTRGAKRHRGSRNLLIVAFAQRRKFVVMDRHKS